MCVQHTFRIAYAASSKLQCSLYKEADKGGGIVLMNTDFYKRKILEMLVDESYYSHILDNCRKETFHKIRNLIGTNGNLTNMEIDFLLNFDCKI